MARPSWRSFRRWASSERLAIPYLAGGTSSYTAVTSSSSVAPGRSLKACSTFSSRAKQPGTVRLVFDVTGPDGKGQTLRVADSQHEQAFSVRGRTHVEVTVAVPRGVSRLLLKTDPPPTSEADALLLSTPRAEPGAGAATLHADVVSADPGF